MKNNRYIPKKNYIIALVLTIGSILLVLYGFSWYKAYQQNLYHQSYLVKNKIINKEITSLEELKNIINEPSNEYFILISYNDNKDVYKLEKDLKKTIKKNNLEDYFYYYNVTEEMKDDNYLKNINEALNLTDYKIKNVPTIVFIRNGIIEKDAIISRDDNNMINVGDFQKLLDIYNIEP